MKRCIVFAAGSYYGLRITPRPDDYIVAADAGYRVCGELGIRPHLILGDFDSMPRPDTDCEVVSYPTEKDDTDTMLALKEGLAQGCTEFHLFGGTGGDRPDHTLANLQALAWLTAHGAHGLLYDRDYVYTVLRNGSMRIGQTVPWGVLSVFSIGGTARGVSIRGVQYPLRDASLAMDFPLGVSNHIIEASAEITVVDGCVVIVWELPPGTAPAVYEFSAACSQQQAAS